MSLELDLTNVEAWSGGTILSPGQHLVQVMEAKEGKSSSGHPQLELQMQAMAGEEKGGEIRDWIVFIPESAGRVKQMLLAFGVDAGGRVALSPDALVGKRAVIVVRNETYNGQERTKVKAYQKPDPAAAAAQNGAAATGARQDHEKIPF